MIKFFFKENFFTVFSTFSHNTKFKAFLICIFLNSKFYVKLSILNNNNKIFKLK
jgi:hypothetical protein